MDPGQQRTVGARWLALLLACVLVAGCSSSPPSPAANPTAAPAAENTTAPAANAAEPTAAPGDTTEFRVPGFTIVPPQSQGGTVIHGVGEPDSYSPIDSYWTPVNEVIYGGLIDLHPTTYAPGPSLAESWEHSDDYSVWTVRLREGVTWHDGQPFTADDVKFTYDLLMNPDGPSQDVGYVTTYLAATTVVDRYTVEFRAASPTADFLPLVLTDFRIAPAHILRDVPLGEMLQHPHFTGDDPAAVIGTGPFRFQERGDGFVRLVRYDDYWEGPPILDEIIFRFIEDTTAAETQLQSGELDIFNDLDPSALRKFANSDITTVLDPGGAMRHILFNLDPEQTTLFQDVRVRQALALAIDREAMTLAAEDGVARVGPGIVPPDSTLYNPEGVTTRYDYDPERAAALLDEAGWVVGADGVRAKDGDRLAFTLHIPGDDATRQIMAEAMQEYWRAIGVAITIAPEDGSALDERVYEAGDFEAVLETLSTAMFAPDQFYFLGCASSGADANASGYCNPEVDELFKQAITEGDLERRRALYSQIENLVMADLPILPLNFSTEIYGYNNRVHNYATSYSGIFNAHTWWVEP